VVTLEYNGIEALIGIFLPPVIDLVNTHVADTRIRYIISLLIALAIGFVLSLGQLTVTDVLGSAAIVFAAAQSAYKLYWEKSEPRAKLKTRLTSN